MKKSFFVLLLIAACMAIVAAAPEPNSDHPQFTTKNELILPANYRQWVFLSSGLGMSYGSSSDHPMFTNVFTPQWAYNEFLKSGKWPNQSIFVVEERGSETKGSINHGGRFQTDIMGLAVEVKDESRFPDKWAYFGFSGEGNPSSANPKTACWQCHEDHAAVEHTFVQFYPTLKPVAQKFGTYKASAEQVQ
ncbi:MAG TPA: cytochrome P460 family protein [Terriglobales bacterium]